MSVWRTSKEFGFTLELNSNRKHMELVSDKEMDIELLDKIRATIEKHMGGK
jgi:hypothetical protein